MCKDNILGPKRIFPDSQPPSCEPMQLQPAILPEGTIPLSAISYSSKDPALSRKLWLAASDSVYPHTHEAAAGPHNM